MRPVGQAVKTPPSHGGNRGSIPLRVTTAMTNANSDNHYGYRSSFFIEHFVYLVKGYAFIPVLVIEHDNEFIVVNIYA